MTTVAPGWYADSNDPALIRWWDGAGWSEHTQPNPAAAVSPPASSAPVPPPFASTSAPEFVVPPAADAAPSRRDSRQTGSPAPSPSIPVAEPVRLVPPSSTSFPLSEPVRLVPPTAPPVEEPGSGWLAADPPAGGADSGTFAVTPLATVSPAPASASTPWTSSANFAHPTNSPDLSSVDYEPMVRTWGASRSDSGSRTITGVSTAGAWMLALSPLLQLALIVLGWVLTEGGTSVAAPAIISGLGFALLAWIVIAVIADFRRLGSLGHDYRPSVVWILVGPLMYLIARAIHLVRTAGRGAAPAWVYVVLSIVAGAAIAAASVALPREASLIELRQVESTIVADMQMQGSDFSVICPDEATLAVGSTFVCTAYDEVGPVALLRVTYGGIPGSFTYAVESSTAAPLTRSGE